MSRKFWKKCGCGGDPTCLDCKGSNRREDREAEMEYADYCRDLDKDDKLTGHGRYEDDGDYGSPLMGPDDE